MVAEPIKTSPKKRSLTGLPPFSRIRFLVEREIARWAERDRARISLWTPVAVGLGAGLYFSLKTEPHWIWGAGAFIFFAALWARSTRLRSGAAALMFAALGFVAADLRTALVDAPQLTRELGIVEISGRLISVEQNARQRRYVIALESVEGFAVQNLPARARITWRGDAFDARPGERITVRAGLSPPPPPVAPGAFDFARQLYFQRIGAVGFAVSAPERTPDAQISFLQKAFARNESLRLALADRIASAAPGEGGAILAAIVTGKRDAISEKSEDALRDAGLAHLLAISGLHMGLATGLVFFTVRFLLAAIEPIALRYPIKKWAALAALASGVFYLILSGGGWSARRAFIMTAIIFAAVAADRRALSLRNVAVAAIIILLTTPEALFNPGFQMSFAAVTALIAAYEMMGERAGRDDMFSVLSRAKRYLAGLAATDVIAALATAPYALYHFNRVAIYSLPANMIAMPIMAFFVVPFAILALVLAPFGMDGWAWRLAAAGMEAILSIASHVSSWRGAVSITAQWPLSAMLALTIGGLWLCLMRAPWRLAGLAAIPVAAVLTGGARPPSLFVSPTGLNAGVVAETSDGARQLYVHSARREKFAVSLWEEAAGIDAETVRPMPLSDIFACDETGCSGAIKDQGAVTAAFTVDKSGLAEDCQRADIVIAFFPATPADWKRCKALLIDRHSAWKRGAHAVWIETGDAIKIKTAAQARGARPWTRGG